jgi:uncharacterized protein YbjT (DUF2867 family)
MVDKMPVISENLAGKRIAITGSTGFVGTALVERLLRSVPDCVPPPTAAREKAVSSVTVPEIDRPAGTRPAQAAGVAAHRASPSAGSSRA